MAGGRSILIIEDEPLIAMMLEDFVESLGHVPAGTADNVDDALICVERGGFDFAILDVNLGASECWPVADALAARRIPFVLATGGHVNPPPAEHAGAPTLPKPFTLDSVRDALESMVSESDVG
jgi:DNA-binding response OmpR family regulator